jgi:hypothetical protein
MRRIRKQSMRMEELIKMLRAELPDLDEEEAEERDLWPLENDRI